MPGPRGPTPPKERRGTTIYLSPEIWDDYDEMAGFHEEVFADLGIKSKVSRNDMIESNLAWARDEYWMDKGGKPTSDRDRKEKVKAFAERLKAARLHAK